MLDRATYQGAARRQLNLREALAWLCAAEVSSKEQRRLSMAQGREAVARGYTLQFTTAMEEWDEVYSFGEGCTYGDQVVATAILERLLHHSCRDPGCGVCVSWGFSLPSLADREALIRTGSVFGVQRHVHRYGGPVQRCRPQCAPGPEPAKAPRPPLGESWTRSGGP